MPVDYSKWDALELSDDSDIEVHPNVDKRSFIRAKQHQIHMQRQQRRHEIETLKYERIINDALHKRFVQLHESLKARADEAKAGNPGEVAFRVVMESAAGLDPKDDQVPPRPEGVHSAEEQPPTYTKMMATMLDQVNKALDEKNVAPENRYEAMLEEIQGHIDKVTNVQGELLKRLAELEAEEKKKITSDDIHDGFNSSFINKSSSSSSAPSGGSKSETKVELLNPNYAANSPSGGNPPPEEEIDENEEIKASPLAQEFAKIPASDYRASHEFLVKHREILTERESDGLLLLAFDAQIEGREEFARNCVHQALLLQYCRALGRDGVALFFKRIQTPGHPAQDTFWKDVSESYSKIRNRARVIAEERAKNKEEAVEQIQLHAVEPGTTINFKIPDANSEDPEVQKARAIFDSFSDEMKKALETGKLDEVNKVLGQIPCAEAEGIVEKLGEAGILSLEEEIIDATTEEGKEKWKQMEEQGKKAAAEFAPDPE
ncbi:hypothetical protein VTJ04DRAFT_1220 [Mycothermus thermophilus]|uniref:uncharacterized protein n=1 Tax=Humicola insolens TaxID=85995 RepID=UPI0037424A11